MEACGLDITGGETMNIGCPACTLNAISIGASTTANAPTEYENPEASPWAEPSDGPDNIASFSSVGPTWPKFSDCQSYEKPDLVAPGKNMCAAEWVGSPLDGGSYNLGCYGDGGAVTTKNKNFDNLLVSVLALFDGKKRVLCLCSRLPMSLII